MEKLLVIMINRYDGKGRIVMKRPVINVNLDGYDGSAFMEKV